MTILALPVLRNMFSGSTKPYAAPHRVTCLILSTCVLTQESFGELSTEIYGNDLGDMKKLGRGPFAMTLLNNIGTVCKVYYSAKYQVSEPWPCSLLQTPTHMTASRSCSSQCLLMTEKRLKSSYSF